MTNLEYRHFLNLLMASDPWPLDDGNSQRILLFLADKEATSRGYKDWVEAYHSFDLPGRTKCGDKK